MNGKISIVLPTYNGEQHIRKSIESVLHQTFTNWELIIVNDCSTDNTESVILEYANKDARIRIVNNETNMKLPRSLNIGFSHANGEFLTWTSDDNAYHKDALECMYNALTSNADIDLVYADYNVVDMSGNIINEKIEADINRMSFHNVVGACFLYRKSIADQIGEYDPEFFLAEDYEYWIRVYITGHIMHIPQNLYDYGWHDKSLTSTRKNEIRTQTYRVKEKYFNELLGKCKNQRERNIFFWKMMSLLNDSKQKQEIRKKYYQLDFHFAIADTVLRLKSYCRQKIKYVFSK